MTTEPRPAFVALVLAACAAGAICNLASSAGGGLPVVMRAEGIVRVSGGQPILVLAEKNGGRRLAVPVRAIESLGGRIVRAPIGGVRSRHAFRCQLSLGRRSRGVLVEASS